MLALLMALCAADERHVDPAGSDSNPGSAAAPWATISKAAREAKPGDLVHIRPGTYRERVTVAVSGTESAPITFRGAPGARIEGTTLQDPGALVRIENRSHLVIEDLEITGASGEDTPCGVLLEGAGRDVTLRRLKVSGIRSKEDAHAIAVFGRDGKMPWSWVLIESCEVFDCRLGSSEAIVVNGNVEGFAILGCTVRDCDNIGIDVIGLEGTAPADDQPRRGRVALNKVFNISSGMNPAYEGERSAAGIYVDGARDILVERNFVHHCDYGIEVGCENPGSCSDVIVRSNVLVRNHGAGLIFGGYDAECGWVERGRFEHNTLWGNDTGRKGEGELVIQKSRSCVIRHNLFVPGGEWAVTNPFAPELSADHVLDWNFYGLKAAAFTWREEERRGLAALRKAKLELNGRQGDPRLVDPDQGDFSLRRDSPAIDGGDPAFKAGREELDFAGAPRLAGRRPDFGAYEFRK